jgi:methionine-rich copper-binding protein CopC
VDDDTTKETLMIRSARTVLALMVASAIAALAVPGALAHTEPVATSPRSGATVANAPTRVTVTFSAVIRGGTIVVRASGGTVVSRGPGGRDPANAKRLRVGLRTGLASGRYTVRWVVRGADGHEQHGVFRFTVR